MIKKDTDDYQESYWIHVLLELYCGYNWESEKKGTLPKFCKKGAGKPGYHCFENDCKYKAFTHADDKLCKTGELGEVQDYEGYIGFGDDMYPDDYNEEKTKELKVLWDKISKQKIDEAYVEYMKQKKSMKS